MSAEIVRASRVRLRCDEPKCPALFTPRSPEVSIEADTIKGALAMAQVVVRDVRDRALYYGWQHPADDLDLCPEHGR